MATVDINGSLVDFPDDLSPEDLQNAVSQAASQLSTPPDQPDNRGMVRKGWDALAIPEKMSRQGLDMIAKGTPNPQPGGNLLLDIARGTPRIAAETLAETAPPFVSRGAILTSVGAPILRGIRPVASVLRKGAFGQAEDMAMGAKGAGALEATYNDASTILSRGKEAAKSLYQAAKSESSTNLFKGMYKPEQIVDAAQEHMAQGGKLLPSEALMARKAIDSLMKSGRYVKDELMAMRDAFDAVAKSSENIAAADPLYRKGMQGEALRKLMPQNLRGGASPFKVAVGTALSNMGTPGKILSAGLSPIALGVGATGLGMTTRQIVNPLLSNPRLAASVYAVLKNKFEAKQ